MWKTRTRKTKLEYLTYLGQGILDGSLSWLACWPTQYLISIRDKVIWLQPRLQALLFSTLTMARKALIYSLSFIVYSIILSLFKSCTWCFHKYKFKWQIGTWKYRPGYGYIFYIGPIYWQELQFSQEFSINIP